MRPRVGSRGSPAGPRGRSRSLAASMRPRVGSRGSAAARQSLACLTMASMRPRVGSRGSVTPFTLGRSAAGSFNEAPSWFSGKFSRTGLTVRCSLCFNEAPSWFSGKLPVMVGPAVALGASMRPRVGSRGSENAPTPSPAAARWASMRPRVGSRGSDRLPPHHQAHQLGFNEAPSWFSGKYGGIAISESLAGRFNEAPSWFSGK